MSNEMNSRDKNNSSNLTMHNSDEKYLLAQAVKCFNEKDYAEAENFLTELIKISPLKSEYYSGLALVQKNNGKAEEAELNYKKAIEINPASLESIYNLGVLQYEKGSRGEAVKAFIAAIKMKEDFYLAYYNLGNIYRELNDFNAAIEYYKKAVIYKIDFEEAYYNLGVVYEKSRKFELALENYRKAIDLNPGNINAHWNSALIYLQLGSFEKGWQAYEVRKKRDKSTGRKFKSPELINQPVNGKKIFVYSEQGLGDSIQFARYLKILKESGAYVIFECKPRLMELFRGIDGVDELVPENHYDENSIKYDYYISLMSLPLYFKTGQNNIPAGIPYLKMDRARINNWADRISDVNCLNIGIAWSGAAENITGKSRSCPLEFFAGIAAIKGVKLYSLQDKISEEEKSFNILQSTVYEDFDKLPFMDTAAMMVNLDLIISVDTSIAHLAGALGRPVWTLLPYFSDWRWGLDKPSTVWYPTMRLFRQSVIDKWDSVFYEVENEIKIMILSGKNNIGLI